MEGGGTGAYGSGAATGNFDFVAFIKKPQVILRIISWLFAVVVFGCISSQAMNSTHGCAYGDQSNCGYGIAVGVLAFLGLLVFLVLDALFDNFSNVQNRKYIVVGDVVFSGLWSFLWFVCFCLLADKWRRQPNKHYFGQDGVQAAIAFSFFSIATFVALTVLAGLRYRKGISDDFLSTDYDQTPYVGSGAPYSGGTEQGGAPYQASNEYSQSPFAPQDAKPVPGGYQQQTY
jgi:uncharacterized membrane protein YuzA (DUF378 family)